MINNVIDLCVLRTVHRSTDREKNKGKSQRAKDCPGEDFKVPKESFPSVLFCFEGERGKDE